MRRKRKRVGASQTSGQVSPTVESSRSDEPESVKSEIGAPVDLPVRQRPRRSNRHPIERSSRTSAFDTRDGATTISAPARVGNGETPIAHRTAFSAELINDARALFEKKTGMTLEDDVVRNYIGDLVDFVMLFRR